MQNSEWEDVKAKAEAKRHRAYFDTFINPTIIVQTDKAMQVRIKGVKYWIPLSIIERFEVDIEGTGEMTTFLDVPKWFTEKNGITGAFVYDKAKGDEG